MPVRFSTTHSGNREFGGDPTIVGRNINLDGHSFSILGVMPPSFIGLEPARRFDVAVPICADILFAENGKGRLDNKAAWWLIPDWAVEARVVPQTRLNAPRRYLPGDLSRNPAGNLQA